MTFIKSMVYNEENIAAKFHANTMYTGDCIVWIGRHDNDGYGNFWTGNRTEGAHRVAWKLVHGPIPAGLQVDHLCRNRACVNVAHLRVCTFRENIFAPGSLHSANRRNPLRLMVIRRKSPHTRRTPC
jgi:4-alpha-glucanotransferase